MSIKNNNFHQEIRLLINKEWRITVVRNSDTLLRVLREKLGITSAKIGCENGDCGACTVLLDGRPVKACLLLAVEIGDQAITTLEGLSDTNIQAAFIEKCGFQCGYCTSGFLLNAYAMLEKNPPADDKVQLQWAKSNLCRCTGYESIKLAIEQLLGNKDIDH